METNSPENVSRIKNLNKLFELTVKQETNPFKFENTNNYSGIITDFGLLLIKIDKNNITCLIELQNFGIKQELNVVEYMRLSRIYLDSYRKSLNKRITTLERKINFKVKIKSVFEIFLNLFTKTIIEEKPIPTEKLVELIEEKDRI